MNRPLLVTAAVFLMICSARAGVTIHYEGYATSTNAVGLVISIATAFAKNHDWAVKDVSVEKGKLERVIDEKNKDYEGRVTGIILYPGKNCEPLCFQFGYDLFMQDYTKTQFAGAALHVDIIALLDELKPQFRKFVIEDEGEYWETRDRAKLENHIATVNRMIGEIKKQKPKANGPVFLPSGRVVDVLE
jgi:hypothetical protein